MLLDLSLSSTSSSGLSDNCLDLAQSMGESLVEAPKIEIKMGESVPCLQSSVSFGRFEHDSLCWERWSTFPTNKYLEEVEKCSTPGSVAQKKAYFEAHYKKIAARKAELLDQEKKRENESLNSEDQSQTSMSSVCNTGEEESDGEKPKAQDTATGSELENEEVELTKEGTDSHIDVPGHGADIFDEEKEVADVSSEMSVHIDESYDEADIVYEDEDLQRPDMDAGEDLCPEMGIPVMDKLEESVSVEEEGISNLESQDMEILTQDKVEERKIADKDGQDIVKLDSLKKSMEELAQGEVEERKVVEEEAEDVEKSDTSKETPKELPLDKVEDREVAKLENEDLVKSENPMEIEKELLQDKFEIREIAKKVTKAPAKLENPKKMQKELPLEKTTNTTNAKQKSASPMARKLSPILKSPMLSTPKSSKPALSRTAMSTTSMMKSQMLSTPKSSRSVFPKTTMSTTTTRPSVKKESGSTPLTSKKATRPESKRVLPTSLHMSLSLGTASSKPDTQMTTRKSLIMEKMGDKDIVKRAFKTFRNFSHSLSKAPASDQLTLLQFSDKKVEEGSALDISLKKHERIAEAVKPSSPASGQQGTRKTGVSLGLYKTGDVDKRNVKSLPGSLGLRSQNQGHKQKEISKNLEQKSRTKGPGETHLESKVKLEKPATVKTPNRENSKAKLSSSYNQGHGFFKGLRKNDTKSQVSG